MLGQSIGNFQIVGKVGEGGMGVVYIGEHRRIARKVAIKVLRAELSHDHEIVERFFTEARATSLIRHPGLVEVSDCDVLPDGSAYIVMELLEGQSLGTHLRSRGRLPVPQALVVAWNVADALAAAHDRNIVHRDLKPDNIFLLSEPGPMSAQPIKILDFGIAKLMDTASSHKTRTGTLLGTPVYMSPEQCRGAGDIDHRTDIYALGCVLFEMLCGQPPFNSHGFGELIQSHLMVTPPAASSMEPAVPPALDDLIARMLAKSPADRPQTMRAFLLELDAIKAGAGIAVGAPAAPSVHLGPSPASGRVVAGGTMLLPQPSQPSGGNQAKLQTTLASASAEKLAALGEAPKPGRMKPIWAAAIAIAVVGGAVGIWASVDSGPVSRRGRLEDDGARRPAEPAIAARPAEPEIAAPPRRPVEPPPAAAAAPEPPVAAQPPPAARRIAASPASERSPAPAPAAPKTGKPKVTITSQPSGADVCLASDRILLGRTKLSLSPDRFSSASKLLIRKRGYRGQEVSVGPGGDPSRHVKLDRLGPDDMENIDNCAQK
jgi:serine/threonine-protein kinase